MTDCKKPEQFVCISCVEEVRYSFVSHLSDALRRNGISVFIDTDDLLSKEAQEKVGRARVSVMIFPGNRKVYLEKLVEVLKCQKNDDQVVVPVLYGESPSLHGEWLSALELSGLSPVYQSRKECSDSQLVDEIVRNVNEKLLFMGRIGIYSKLLEIENMINKQPLGIRCVGIWGLTGIGKTTLAKAVFDQVSGGFDACCFIQDYDQATRENRVHRILVEQLMKDQPGNSGTITRLRLRRDKLNNKRVLVVLDDVRNPLVAESFLEEYGWFGPESLIVITSSDRQVFRLCRINQIYEVQGLNEKDALQLFMLCASMNDTGEQNLHELVMKVIKYANGNPLALSIFGEELKGKKTPVEMETAFLELKERPPSKFVGAITSSYDTLNDSEKNIFLDIACFFQGENVDYVMQLLEGCGFFPRVGIDVLVEKCLVTVSENQVRMHNLIQDLVREVIVKGETVQMETRSRLWEPRTIRYLLEDNGHTENGEPKTTVKCVQGTEEIEGIFLDTSNLNFDVNPAAFENMLNLRLLKIYCSNPEIHPVISFPKGFLKSLPNELRLLHWENYPLQTLPRNFYPRHLVEINMPNSQLNKLWGGTKNLEMLKTIRLCHSQQLVDIDDVLKAQNLEVIDLQGCTRLQSFPATCQLLHLRVINLSGCTEIKIFPEVPPNIETLHLQGTGIVGLPLSILKPSSRELESLLAEFQGLSDALKVQRVTSLMESSSSCQDLGKLIFLDLKDCSRLQSLPDMGNLEFLKVLDLSGCSQLETIQGFPTNLKELYIAGTAVREVPQLPKSLELLYAHGCISLKSICFDCEQFPMHYTFSNCFDLSPQVVNDFLVKALATVKHLPIEHPQKLKKPLPFSFCVPSHVNQNSTLDLQPGSSVMTRLNPLWKSTLVGFAMLVEVAFSEDFYDATGFGITCVCRWKNKEGHSYRIERNLHCWAAGIAVPKVQKDHLFVFCDAKMRPSTDEGNDPNIVADLVVFEFFPINNQMKRLDDTCTVTRCGVSVITTPTGNTSLEHISAGLSLDPVDVFGNEAEEVLRVSYDGLQERYKALFLYMACLFHDEDVDLVAPVIARIDMDISSGLKDLASRSLIRVSSNGELVMHCFLRQMGKEILHRQLMLPGSSTDLTRDSENVSVASSSSHNWKYDICLSFSVQDLGKKFLSHILVALKHKSITIFTVFSTFLIGVYVFVHIVFAIPGAIQGLEFNGLDLPDSVGEFVVSGVLVLQCERVLKLISRFMQARKQKGSDHGIKAHGDGWLLTVALIEGVDLAAVDSSGHCDPYIVFSSNGKTRTSSIKFQKSNPQWNEIFEFDAMADPPSVLNVEVFDFDGPFDEAVSLGHAEINFVRSNISDLADVWIPLQGKLAQACQSKLHLRIFLDHTGSGDVVRDYLNKMEKEVGKKINVRSPQTNSAFQKLFGFPREEFLINDFTCHLKRKMPLQGRLFLSARIVGFYASLFGNKTNFFFLWEDIEDIQVLPPTLASMGSPIIVMTLRPGRGMDARIGAKTHDEEGRLKFHFHSFVSFNVAQKTIMALWKAKSLTPEQKVQAVEEESEQKLVSEESGLFLGVDDVRFAEVYSLTLPVPVSFFMELFGGGEVDRKAMERAGCQSYSCSPWESEKDDVYERQTYYRDKRISRYRGEVTSTQQKSLVPDKNGWLVEEVMTLHGVPLGDYFNLHLRYQMEELASKPKTAYVRVYFGIEWLKSSRHQKRVTKNILVNLQDRLKMIFGFLEKEYGSKQVT